MGWSWRRARPTTGRHAASRSVSSSVSAPQPQPQPEPALAATPAIAATPAPTETPLPPAPVPAAAATPGVLLGFRDGTEVALADGDPRATALQKVADVLVRGDA